MKNILCIAGDGIGPEIMNSALEILEVISKKYDFKYKIEEEFFGGASIDAYGEPFSDKLKEKIRNCDAILMGSVGGPKWDNAKVRPEAGLLALRKYLKVYANVRPLKVEDSLCYLSPLKEEIVKGTDLMIVRELTGGAYFGEPRKLEEKSALDSITYTYEEIELIVRYAFETARKRRKKLTSVDKANVLATSKLWRKVVEDVAKDYEDIELEHMFVDAMAMALVTNPTKYDVIVASDYMVDTMIKEGMLEKLDKSKIPNMEKVKKEYRNLVFDPTFEYSVPYTIGNIGIAYDKSKQEKVDSWADLWSEKNKGEVVMLDGSRFTMAIAMIKEGIDPNSTKVEDIEKAKNSLIAQKKIVKNYVGDDQAKDNLISGDSKLTCIWGGEALLAKDENKNVEFVFPKEGAIFIFDNWVIPKVSENKELAAKFIDFMSRPEISARNCNVVKYGSPIFSYLIFLGEYRALWRERFGL